MQNNPYIKTVWKDHIVDAITQDVIQEGTRFTATRANNIEDGIYNSYQWLIDLNNNIQQIGIQLEMLGRAPVNNGTFFDTLSGDSKLLTLFKGSSISKDIVNIGATTVSVDNTFEGLKTGVQVTVFDDEQSEDVYVLSVDSENKTVTFSTALLNQYKKGAYIVRSNSYMNTAESKLQIGNWGTFTVSVSEVV